MFGRPVTGVSTLFDITDSNLLSLYKCVLQYSKIHNVGTEFSTIVPDHPDLDLKKLFELVLKHEPNFGIITDEGERLYLVDYVEHLVYRLRDPKRPWPNAMAIRSAALSASRRVMSGTNMLSR
ncbi:CUN101 hypothetical protein [Culex nigripalpus nucleopolyhedrovirus]|uniref:Uncharacterized protein n=1 Tax=Culex nigripalpus nucleopolyhedrovirus (isolate Florida/1997) TaxID=645993 RepID=Q919H6_NPVCO|nr:CUN101 hypothetical protein [Culex nigripalpus nucleopolyhedrovirus]AAK94179.1 CUN101 hypothetical protein [Culex nigripalpus nucleopolyhedrovirus]